MVPDQIAIDSLQLRKSSSHTLNVLENPRILQPHDQVLNNTRAASRFRLKFRFDFLIPYKKKKKKKKNHKPHTCTQSLYSDFFRARLSYQSQTTIHSRISLFSNSAQSRARLIIHCTCISLCTFLLPLTFELLERLE